jgi:hypothetical protein
MRTRIKVTDLTVRQWEHVLRALPAGYDMPEEAVRVYVEFEIDIPDEVTGGRRVEMPVRAFIALMTQLQRIERHQPDALMVATAALTPDALPDRLEAVRNVADPVRAAERVTCDHGSPVVRETPSAFEGADPVRTFADGCQSVGPYAADQAPCKCGFRAPELGPHPACPVHSRRGDDSGDVLDGYTGRPY